MAEHDQDQRTEEATPKQKERFRERGDVARSQDLAAVVAIAGGVGALLFAWGIIGSGISGLARGVLGRLDMHHNYAVFLDRALDVCVRAMTPVAVTGLVLGVAAQLAQVGFSFSFKPMEFRPEKFNPFPRLRSMIFSTDTVIEITKSVLKVVVIGGVAAAVLWDEVRYNGRLIALAPVEIMGKVGSMGVRIAVAVVLALSVVAVLDILIERWRYAKRMRMTKEEVKQEYKDTEGDPLVRSRIRGKQQAAARARMNQDVSKADVVVVNPTHYAVALHYDMVKDPAPMIVAAGVDKVAAHIRTKARQASVPVVSNPPLARALYAQGKVGQPIPKELFAAVAQLLAWVYKVTGRM